MTARRLLEMIAEHAPGAGGLPVMFTSYVQRPSGAWEEHGSCEPITSVRVLHDEVLLIRESECPPMSVDILRSALTTLSEAEREFTVDTCEPPIETEEYGPVHIDLPVNGVSLDNVRQRLLLVYASKQGHA